MTRAGRNALLALSVLVTLAAVTGVVTALRLEGWPRLRGVVGGLVAAALGGRVLVATITQRWPAWLDRWMGDGDPL
jgi:hypothetical protein